MAVDHWWLGTTNTNHTVAANWSTAGSGGAPGVSVPGTGDEVMFDGNGNNPCTLFDHWSLLHLTTVVGYNAKLDLAIYNLTMDDGGNVTVDGGGTFDGGSGNHSIINGILDNKDVGSWTTGASTWTLNGTCSIIGHYSRNFYNLTFAVGSTVTIAAGTDTRIDVQHTCTINGAVVLNKALAAENSGDFVINDGASFSGSSYLMLPGSTSGHGFTVIHANVTMPETRIRNGANDKRVVPGTWGGLFKLYSTGGSNNMLVLDNGVYNFNGNLELENGGTGTVTLQNKTNVPTINVTDLIVDINSTGGITIDDDGQAVDWDISGDVIDGITGGGTFTYTKGNGTFTASGSNDQDWDLMDQTVEDIVIDKSAGTLTLYGSFTTDTFTGTDGTFDPNEKTITVVGDCNWAAAFVFDPAVDCMNGCTWDIGGNFTADGQTLKATATWYLQVDGTAVASGTGAVAHSDASGYTEIDASAGPWTDNLNNANWDFGISVPVIQHHRQQQGVAA